MLCSDDMIQYLLDECNRTFNDHYGSLVTGSGQIVYCLISIIQTNAYTTNTYFVNSHANNPFQQVFCSQNRVLPDNHGSQWEQYYNLRGIINVTLFYSIHL